MKKIFLLIITLFIIMNNVGFSEEIKFYEGIKTFNQQSLIYENNKDFINFNDNLTLGIISEKLYLSEKLYVSGGVGINVYHTYEIVEINGQNVNKNIFENDAVMSIGGGYEIDETTNLYIDHIMSDAFDNQTWFGIQITF